jgi:2-polyprenyl-3-methyl-5-hydroxy-6-metoxy-1,4-benzoquinol methylase
MGTIRDERGFSQIFEWNQAQTVRMARRGSAIAEATDSNPGDTVLEIGCGTGEMAHALVQQTPASVVAVDLSRQFIDQATARFHHERLRYACADLNDPKQVKSLGGPFSAVVGNGILHHLFYNLGPALKSFSTLLKPGGRFVFWEPNIFNPYVFAIFRFEALRRRAKLEHDEMAFGPEFISRHLRHAGFTDIDVSFRDFLLPNVPAPLVNSVAALSDVVEKIPGVNRLAQSLFIAATYL